MKRLVLFLALCCLPAVAQARAAVTRFTPSIAHFR